MRLVARSSDVNAYWFTLCRREDGWSGECTFCNATLTTTTLHLLGVLLEAHALEGHPASCRGRYPRAVDAR